MKHLIAYIKSTTNLISFILCLAPSLLLWAFKPSQTVPLLVCMVLLYIAFALLWAFVISLFAIKSISANGLKYGSIYLCNADICLCEENPSFSTGMFVTISLVLKKGEHTIGYGEVINIQDNKLIQLSIHKIDPSVISDDSREFYQIISDRKRDIVVKPTVSRAIIDYIK